MGRQTAETHPAPGNAKVVSAHIGRLRRRTSKQPLTLQIAYTPRVPEVARTLKANSPNGALAQRIASDVMHPRCNKCSLKWNGGCVSDGSAHVRQEVHEGTMIISVNRILSNPCEPRDMRCLKKRNEYRAPLSNRTWLSINFHNAKGSLHGIIGSFVQRFATLI